MLKRIFLVLMFVAAMASPAFATTYYLSSTGVDAANGTSTSTPWRTFARAITTGSPKVECGDTLVLLEGTFGNTTVTGNLNITSRVCTASTILTIRANTSRQATIVDNGSGQAVFIQNSAYITLDGLVIRSTDASGSQSPGQGQPLGILGASPTNPTHHIILRNIILYHPNRFSNTPAGLVNFVTDSTFEDVEIYNYHRHGLLAVYADRNTWRRVYCNSRLQPLVPGDYESRVGGFVGGDSCVGAYPGSNNIFENVISEGNFKGFNNQAESDSIGNQVLGSISLNDYIGTAFTERQQGGHPINVVFRNDVTITPTQSAYDLKGAENTTLSQISVFGGANTLTGGAGTLFQGTTLYQILTQDPGIVAAPQSTFMTNILLAGTATNGFAIGGQNSWSLNYPNANSSGITTKYNPDDGNITNKNTSAQGMGACYLWVPDASLLNDAGFNGADIGATILYRYQYGVLTTTPLWDPTTGEFPHGALVAGINDVAGRSLFDVHKRVNVPYSGSTHGCEFPASFTGETPPTPPANPSTYESSEGTTSTSHAHTLAADMDSLIVFVHLRDSGSNVGSVSGVTACGGEALTLQKRQTSGSGAGSNYHAVEIWAKLTPTTGACTIAVATTGTVTSVVTTSIAQDDVSEIGAVAGAGNLSTTPSVAVATNTGETIISGTSFAKAFTLSAGANQTLQVDTPHSTAASRLAISTQAGADGGVMDYIGGGTSYWAHAVISLVPQGGSTPQSPLPTLTQRKGQWRSFFGTEAAATTLPYSSAPVNTNAVAHPTGKVRVRVSIIAQDNDYPPSGFKLFCSENGGAYAEATDTFGSKKFRLIGAGYDPLIPSSLSPTTQIIDTGTFTAGVVLRSDSAATTLTLLEDHVTELEWPLELNAAAGDTIDCRAYLDSGTAIDTYTVTPRVTVQALSAGVGF